MKASEFFLRGNSYKCKTHCLAFHSFFNGYTYECTELGILRNSVGMTIIMDDNDINYFDKVTHDTEIEDKVNHPKHYTNGPKIILDRDYKAGDIINIECIDVIRDMPAWKANVIKYLWRESLKEEEGYSIDKKAFEDCKKAKWYLDNKINELLKKERYNIK